MQEDRPPRAEAEGSAKLPYALFDRAGALRVWDREFFGACPNAPDTASNATIFGLFPTIDAAGWDALWTAIDAGHEVRLPGEDLDEGSGQDFADAVAALTVRKLMDTDGGLAQVSVETTVPAFDRDRLNRLQHEVLEAVATGRSLREVGELICRRAEELVPSVICSILTLDADNRLRSLAGPSLPAHYSKAIDGVQIGPCVGSCGTAAYWGEPVIVADIATDPLWTNFKDLALAIELRACWSSPIKGRNGRVAGTFAFYYRTPRGPDLLDREIVDVCVHLCAIAIDHEAAQARVQKLALCDALTNLPNRAHFQQHASDILRVLPMSQRTLALLYIDLDDFKSVNDTLGHCFGDQLLKGVADRFRACCRPGEFIARLGGDEFAVLQFPAGGIDEIEDLANRILGCFVAPFSVDDRKVSIDASIGIACAPADGATYIELLKRADMALYRGKRGGGHSHHFFTAEMDRQLTTRRSLEDELRRAVESGEITVHFQPVVDLNSGLPTGFEALARWQHPKRGVILPADFIGLAEHAGIIASLGNFVLREACAQAAKWPAPLKVAVNLSPVQLVRPNFTMDVISILAGTGLSPRRLEIEITESVRLGENAVVRRILQDLKALGVAIALDDFGTGYSSLSYLQSFPFDRIKIDLSFVRALGEPGPAKPIVEALIALAKNLGMATTAEGVEWDWQRQWLRDRGCGEGQGYFFGKPAPAAEVARLLAEGRAPAAAQS